MICLCQLTICYLSASNSYCLPALWKWIWDHLIFSSAWWHWSLVRRGCSRDIAGGKRFCFLVLECLLNRLLSAGPWSAHRSELPAANIVPWHTRGSCVGECLKRAVLPWISSRERFQNVSPAQHLTDFSAIQEATGMPCPARSSSQPWGQGPLLGHSVLALRVAAVPYVWYSSLFRYFIFYKPNHCYFNLLLASIILYIKLILFLYEGRH